MWHKVIKRTEKINLFNIYSDDFIYIPFNGNFESVYFAFFSYI